MCGSCGCAGTDGVTILDLQTGKHSPMARDGENAAPRGDRDHHAQAHDHDHHHGGSHSHAHGHHHTHSHDQTHSHGHDHQHGNGRDHPHHPEAHAPAAGRTQVDLERRLLAHNDEHAALNRAWLAGREILALNLVSSPGAGKTTLIERTIRDLAGEMPISVIEGDQATARDGERIRAAGAPAIQINTGSGCHLEADMVDRALRALKPATGSLVIIENVGNLVCPALFDLGERAKVAIFSVTEGEDKPLKYPHMFAAAELVILSKTDLLPHVDFDMALAAANARQVNPDVTVLEASARSGDGLGQWYDWLRAQMRETREAAFA
jgi:hydrogenase nickel incorporation protein HypB